MDTIFRANEAREQNFVRALLWLENKALFLQRESGVQSGTKQDRKYSPNHRSLVSRGQYKASEFHEITCCH